MIRWSVVFLIWAIVAAAIASRGWSPVATDVSGIFSLVFALMFLFFAIVGVAGPRPARAHIRP